MTSLRRTYRPFRLQWIKQKYYLSVTAPAEISHCYQDGRVKRSTSTSDKKLAEIRAQVLVERIYHDFDHKFSLLDPFVEGLRSVLEREQGDSENGWPGASHQYSEGVISIILDDFDGFCR